MKPCWRAPTRRCGDEDFSGPHLRALRAQHHIGGCSPKLTHPIIVVFESWHGLEGMDSMGAARGALPPIRWA
jgi:hypothetical protein